MGGMDVPVLDTGGRPPGRRVGVDRDAPARRLDAMAMQVRTLARRVRPGMRGRGWGRTVTAGSSGVARPIPSLGPSNAIRSALVGRSTSLAGEGVTAGTIPPGRIRAERVDGLDAAKRTGKLLGRSRTAEEFAAVAARRSERARHVTGGLAPVDDGAVRSA